MKRTRVWQIRTFQRIDFVLFTKVVWWVNILLWYKTQTQSFKFDLLVGMYVRFGFEVSFIASLVVTDLMIWMRPKWRIIRHTRYKNSYRTRVADNLERLTIKLRIVELLHEEIWLKVNSGNVCIIIFMKKYSMYLLFRTDDSIYLFTFIAIFCASFRLQYIKIDISSETPRIWSLYRIGIWRLEILAILRFCDYIWLLYVLVL